MLRKLSEDLEGVNQERENGHNVPKSEGQSQRIFCLVWNREDEEFESKVFVGHKEYQITEKLNENGHLIKIKNPFFLMQGNHKFHKNKKLHKTITVQI